MVDVYRAGEEQGTLYISMRLVSGEDLRSALRRCGRFEPPAAAAPKAGSLRPPRMSSVELALFERVLGAGRRRYAEFGTGGSTLLAVRAPFDMIVGVDSDPAASTIASMSPLGPSNAPMLRSALVRP